MLDMERATFEAAWPQPRVWYRFHVDPVSREIWHEEDVWKPGTIVRVDTSRESVQVRSFLYLCIRTGQNTDHEGTESYDYDEQLIHLGYSHVFMYPHGGARMPVEWILMIGAACASR